MKIKLILTAFAFAIASFSFAQTDKAVSMEDKVKQQATELTEQMTTYLDLNESQAQRMLGMNMSMFKSKAAMESMDLSDAEKAEKIKAYEERNNETVKQVLTEEQYEKFKAKYTQTKMNKAEKSKK
ncbi:hypothetical protein O3Q51_08410 [Cryomorphaceae bacterium 1068]|nr:hypothetical protein [Cryomorphaceae bacterium 1068]